MRQISTAFARALLNKQKENLTVKNVFDNGCPTKAKLELTLATGDTYVVDFEYVTTMEVNHDIEDVTDFGSFRQFAPFGTSHIKISGKIKTSTLVRQSGKKEKPETKPRVPSVSASARAVRKATVKHVQLTARINKTEQALTAARAEKIILDKQLEASRQQLLASAAGTR